MGARQLSFFLVWTISWGAGCFAETTDLDERAMIERINSRYDDFFNRRNQGEGEDKARRKGIEEIKRQRLEHQKELRAAQEDYVKNRRKVKEDPKLEAQWLEEQKAWREQNHMAGKRLLEREMKVEAIENRGRRIPGDLEYDLEN